MAARLQGRAGTVVIGIIVVGAVLMDIVFRRGIGGRKPAKKADK